MSEGTAYEGLLPGTKVYTTDTGGPGRPVVLIHGWPLSGESWQYQVPALASAGYRVVTYDRRGFGRSGKPDSGYDYDTLADDLAGVIAERDLREVTLVGFSMGGGEVARYVARHGEGAVRSVVFAAAVTPYLARTADNPDGPLDAQRAAAMRAGLTGDPGGFLEEFITQFFTAGGVLQVTEEQRQDALRLGRQADPAAMAACLDSFASTDFRPDLAKIGVPALVLHGDSDALVPFAGSGRLTHRAIPQSERSVLYAAPHGCHVSHAAAFNQALIGFLGQ